MSREMIRYTESLFRTKEDPSQIPVSAASRAKLFSLSPYTVCVETDGADGPMSWRVTIPTTKNLALEFIRGDITEKEMFDRTEPSDRYDALYLASSTTVPEHRRKGLALKLTKESIERFREAYPIEMIFAWPYSAEGKGLDEKAAREMGIEIRFKPQA